jgi:hypothetical protein
MAVRLFAGFAEFGAAAVDFAIASSFLAGRTGAAGPWPALCAAAAGLWAVVLLLWTIQWLRQGRQPRPRLRQGLLIAASAMHVAAVAAGSGPGLASLDVSHLAALLLTLMIVAAGGWLHRQHGPAAPANIRPARLLLAAFAGAVAVADVATPGLAASSAGDFAVPHGEHGTEVPAGPHHHR